MAVTTIDGKEVVVEFEVTVLGVVTAISGKGSLAVVTVQDLGGKIFTVLANEMYAPQTDGAAISISGKGFSVGDNVSVPAIVKSATGVNGNATLSIQTRSVSQASTSKNPALNTIVVTAISSRAPHRR